MADATEKLGDLQRDAASRQKKLRAVVTVLAMIVIVVFTIYLAGLVPDQQGRDSVSDPIDSPGPAGAIVGFGMIGGWLVVGGVIIFRAQRRRSSTDPFSQ
ncbi:MAG: hypothetical protein R8J94_14915 [Acidimicrobiia bacterium]|nr:hypothetical protein [Acidimicrobiia bacterium]